MGLKGNHGEHGVLARKDAGGQSGRQFPKQTIAEVVEMMKFVALAHSRVRSMAWLVLALDFTGVSGAGLAPGTKAEQERRANTGPAEEVTCSAVEGGQRLVAKDREFKKYRGLRTIW